MSRILCLLTIVCLWGKATQGQTTICAKIDSLKANGQLLAAKKLVFQRLSSPKLTNEDCFYQSGLSLFEKDVLFSLDSAAKIYRVWQTVSTYHCLPSKVYLDLLRSRYSSGTQEVFCSEFKEHYSSCPKKEIPTGLKPYAVFCPSISCSDLDSLYKNEDSLSLEQAKQLLSLLAQRECTTGIYSSLNARILAHEPSYSGLFQQALIFKNAGNYSSSQHYFTQAEKLARSPDQKASCYLGIAETFKLQKNYGKAKDFASFAAEFEPTNPQSFLFLADLYLLAESECNFKIDEQKRALYVLIADCYLKAGNTQKESSYRTKSIDKQSTNTNVYPKKIQLKCFINENITLTK